MNDKQDILQQCVVEGNSVFLPDVQLERKLYVEVAKSLELIGGKWNRSVKGFVFKEDPTDLLQRIAFDEERVNLQQEYQFFPTPDKLADYLVELANIQEDDFILEPSAGQGAIVKAINRVFPNKVVDCCELMAINKNILGKISTVVFKEDDFIQYVPDKLYDKIIANPPFTKNQDINHVYHMYDCLASQGRLVAITSKHWTFSTNDKEIIFREWLKEQNAIIEEIDTGTFKKSGTMVASVIIIVDKQK